jgi:hypothetical protein
LGFEEERKQAAVEAVAQNIAVVVVPSDMVVEVGALV